MKSQRVANSTRVTYENILRIRRFIFPIFFFGRCVVEMIDLRRSVASLGEAIYQSAFLSLEFRLNMFYYGAFQLSKLNFYMLLSNNRAL